MKQRKTGGTRLKAVLSETSSQSRRYRCVGLVGIVKSLNVQTMYVCVLPRLFLVI